MYSFYVICTRFMYCMEVYLILPQALHILFGFFLRQKIDTWKQVQMYVRQNPVEYVAVLDVAVADSFSVYIFSHISEYKSVCQWGLWRLTPQNTKKRQNKQYLSLKNNDFILSSNNEIPPLRKALSKYCIMRKPFSSFCCMLLYLLFGWIVVVAVASESNSIRRCNLCVVRKSVLAMCYPL